MVLIISGMIITGNLSGALIVDGMMNELPYATIVGCHGNKHFSVLTGKGRVTMPDREKVIKGLECCIPSRDKEERDEERECRHQDCPYEHFMKGNYGCFWELMTDALALLKEQRERIETLESLRRIEQEGR